MREWSPPQARWLHGERLHLQHGPIDLIIRAEGEDLEAAYRAAQRRFQTIIEELVQDLPVLRRPLQSGHRVANLTSTTALRMHAACLPFLPRFITPMAAVAGAVADTILKAMLEAAPHLSRAYVNNGGDCALHLAGGQSLTLGLVANLDAASPAGRVTLHAEQGVGGVATSGWPGRSFSLGIADAVTVLARSAAASDAAATIIANAVDAEHPAIRKAPARSLDPDSDLGVLDVTTAVGDLPADLVAQALAKGVDEATRLQGQGLIIACALKLKSEWRFVSTLPLPTGQSSS